VDGRERQAPLAQLAERPAYLTLAIAPGEAAQVDWGHAGTITLGATRRRLSLFAMVLCHSRMAWLEFTCGEAMEHFLSCPQPDRLPPAHWPSIFNNDSTIASAVLDRLLHHSHTIVIEGQSFRMKDS